jgi:hypothetical protein
MPSFDFSKCKLEVWETPLPAKSAGVNIDEAHWDHGRLKIETTSVVSDGPFAPQYLHRFSISCEPLFVLLVADEAMGISLWSRANELGLAGGGHLIVEDSDWISSFKTNEAYGYDWHRGEAVHYVLCAVTDFVHIVSKTPPAFSALGIEPDNYKSEGPPPPFLVRDHGVLNPVRKVFHRVFFGRKG